MEDRTLLDTVRWLGGSGNWSDSSKWNSHVPGAADTAIIDASGTAYTVTLDVNPIIAGFTLNSVNASFFASGRTLTVNGPANLSAGAVVWRSSTWAGTGALTNNAGMTVQGTSSISNRFEQDGSVLIQGSNAGGGSALLTAASAFTNAGTITLQSIDGAYQSNLTVTSGILTNTGVINSNAGSGGLRLISADLLNNGTININTDTSFAKTNGVYTNANAFNVAAGQTLSVNYGGQTFNQNAGTLNNSGTLSVMGHPGLGSATFGLNGGAITGNPPALTSATLSIAVASTATGTVAVQTDSTLSGNVAAGQTIWVRGSNAGTNALLTAASGFTNAGTIILQSIDGVYQSNLTVTSGTLTNAGVINSNAGSGGLRIISADLLNNGTININTDTSFSKLNGVYANTNAFNVAAGQTLSVNSYGQTFNQNAGTLNNNGTFSVMGHPTYGRATFGLNGGSITGNPPALTSATLSIAVASTAAGTVAVQNDSTLSGNVAAGQTIWVRGSNAGTNALLTAASGFTNAGTIVLQSIDGVYQSNLTVTSGILTNAGVINSNAGSGGLRTISADLLNNGTININTDTSFSKPNGVYTNTSAFNVTAGLTINGRGQVFNQNAGTLTSTRGTFDLSGSATFTFNGGRLEGTPILTNAALRIGGPGVGTIVVHGSSMLLGNVPAGAPTVLVQDSIEGSNALLTAPSGFSNAGTITLESIFGGHQSTLAVTSGILTNAGVINSNAGTGGLRTISADLLNNGTININTDTSFLKLNGVYTNANVFNVAAGQTLSVNYYGQTFNQNAGTVNNNGTFSVMGHPGLGSATFGLNGGAITGNPPALTSATLSIAVASTATGTVVVQNDSTLSGNVAVGQTIWVRGSNAGGGSATLAAASTFTNAGTIILQSIDGAYQSNLTVTSGTLTNAASGVINSNTGTGGIRTIAAQLDNQGNINVNQPTTLTRASAAHANSGTITIYGGNLTINQSGTNPSFSNTATIDVQVGAFTVSAGGLRVDGSGVLRSNRSTTISIGGNLLVNTRNADRFAPLGTVRLTGPGSQTSPQLLELMSRDLGNLSEGFARNFAYGTLELANNNYVQLANNSGGPKALYVNSLIVRNGATFDLHGQPVYARLVQVENGGTIVGGMINQSAPGPLSLGVPAAGFIPDDAQVDRWTFFGRARQTVSVIVNTDLGINFAHVRILDPNDRVVGDQTNSQSRTDVSFLGLTLPLDGSYRIEVSAGRQGSRGNYLVTVWNAPIINSPLNLNQRVNGQIDTPFRTDRWNFSAAAGTPIQFDLLNRSNPAVRFDLSGPSGYSRDMLTNGDLVTLPGAGNYALTVSTTNLQTGSYAFRVRQTTVTDLVLARDYSGRLEGSAQALLFRVNVPEAKQLLVELRDSSSADRDELYVKFGSAPTRADYQYRISNPASSSQHILVPTAAVGPWFILVYGEAVPNPSNFRLVATTSTVFLTEVTPDHAGTSADGTLTLTGAGFDRTTRVALVSDVFTYPPDVQSVDLPTQIRATFRANTVPPGIYTVRVEKPGGDMFTLPNAFRLVAGGQARLNTNLVVPRFLGFHGTGTIYVECSNTGDVAMAAPLIVLDAKQNGRSGAFLTLDPSIVVQGFWTSALPDGFSHTIQILASGATPGSLQPGEAVRVPVYYAGWQQPWEEGRFNFTLDVLRTDDNRPIDWNALRDGLRPPSINPDAWPAIFTNLVEQTGNTWGAYVTMLDRNADYLGHLGLHGTDVSHLWNFQVQQALGFSLITHLGDIEDARVPAPGVPLVFSRFFTSSLAVRYELGPLGRGWTWGGGWDQTLRVLDDSQRGGAGTVVVQGTGYFQRRFQPDLRLRGSYFSQPGDHGQLTSRDGVYELRELDGLITRFRADGKIDYIEDPNHNRISASYTSGRLTRLTHTSGQFLQIDYNTAGRVQYVTDPAGRRTTYGYDPSNEYLLSVQTYDRLVTRYDYDSGTDPRRKHALLMIEHPGSTHEFFGYDLQGRLHDVERDNHSEGTTFTYFLGTVAATDAQNHTTQVFFDNRGLVAEVLDPLLNSLHLNYDNAFNLTQLTDALGQYYRYQYDANGNLVRSTDPLGNTTSFGYTVSFNQLASVTEPKGYQTLYDHDPSNGNLQSITYPDNSVERWLNDLHGDPTQWTNRRGIPIRYDRDTAGRVRRVTYGDSSHVDYDYDDRGILRSATDSSGTTTLCYEDPQHPDWVTRIVYPGGRFLAFQYDEAGRRREMTDQGGFTVKYRYDDVGRLWKLLDANENVIVQYTYDATGRLGRKDNGNRTHTTYEYNEAGQVQHLVNYAPDGSINSRFDYEYDPLGRQTAMTTLEGRWTYGYDALGQLTSVQLPNNGRRIQYRHDANGNRISVTDNGVETPYTSNNLNQYVRVGSVVYGYDADGNLISKRDGANLSTFTYDDQNRLIRAVTPEGTWTYEYDVFGNRRASTVNGQRTDYLIDPSGLGDVVGQYNGVGNLISHYTYGLGLVTRIDPTNTLAYYDFDAIGSTVGLTNPAGSYINRYSYLPFGERLASSETIANPFAYVGRWGVMKESNGLDFMRARYHSSTEGRFTSVDPLGIPFPNLYAYANNNPVFLVDPLGLEGGAQDFAHGILRRNRVLGTPAQDIGADQIAKYEQASPQISKSVPGVARELEEIWKSIYEPIFKFKRPKDFDEIPKKVVPPTAKTMNGLLCGGGLGGFNCSPSPPPGSPGGGGSSGSVSSGDPNEKIGPSGYGPANFMALDRAFPYRIAFENDMRATAPAQRVDITDQLASTLDWDTFQLTEIGFGDFLISIPAGARHFQTTVSMTYNDHTFDIEIEAGLNSDTGQAFATFQSIDPRTNLPPDILTGFLPPEDGTGRGMGHISYTIQPKSNLTTGTQIRNIALVTFDLGETIATNQIDAHDPSRGTDPNKEALVTVDAVAPTSSVDRLPKSSPRSFIVSWAGSDDKGGSGLGFFDIFVSTDGGDFVPWIVHITLNGAIFEGEVGHTYGFYSVAIDNAGNREATQDVAQATTTVAKPAAQFQITVNGKSVVAGQPFSITVTALNADGNVITDYAGTVHFASSDIMAGLPEDYTFTADDAGVHTIDGVTLFHAGDQWVRAVDTDTAIGGYTVVTILPAAADHFRVTAISQTRSGVRFDFTIAALDPYANVDFNYRGTVTFTSTDTADGVVLPLDYAFTEDDAGRHVFTDTGRGETTLITEGEQSITVSDGTISIDIPVTVTAANGAGPRSPSRSGRQQPVPSLLLSAAEPWPKRTDETSRSSQRETVLEVGSVDQFFVASTGKREAAGAIGFHRAARTQSDAGSVAILDRLFGKEVYV